MTDFYDPPPSWLDRFVSWLRVGGGADLLGKCALLVVGLLFLVKLRRRQSSGP